MAGWPINQQQILVILGPWKQRSFIYFIYWIAVIPLRWIKCFVKISFNMEPASRSNSGGGWNQNMKNQVIVSLSRHRPDWCSTSRWRWAKVAHHFKQRNQITTKKKAKQNSILATEVISLLQVVLGEMFRVENRSSQDVTCTASY